MRLAWVLQPRVGNAVMEALALWYLTSEQERLLGVRRRLIANGLAALFVIRLINRMVRRQTLALGLMACST